jgi:hypothetical protein
MKKLTLLTGVAVGYVLGSRAGRERYEQIKTGASRVAHNPKVQAAAGKAQDTVAHQAATAADVAKEKVSGVASTAADKVRREASVQPAP